MPESPTLKNQPRKEIYRLLDANVNRAREGLRVVEDTLRFVLPDKKNFLTIRACRHKLTELTKKIYPELIKERNSRFDLGKDIGLTKHQDIQEVIIANFSRVEQALRVLEEYSRIISANAGNEFKAIRYKTYLVEKKVLEKLA